MLLWVLTEWALVNLTHADVIALQGPDLRRKGRGGDAAEDAGCGWGIQKGRLPLQLSWYLW